MNTYRAWFPGEPDAASEIKSDHFPTYQEAGDALETYEFGYIGPIWVCDMETGERRQLRGNLG